MTLRYDTRSRVSTYTRSWVSGIEPDFGVFDSIATTVLSSSTSTITFSSIPAGYKHLQIRFLSRTDRANNEDVILLRFNSDSAANYSSHYLYGDGASAGSGGASGASSIPIDGCVGASTTASIFGGGIVDILDYGSADKYKTVRALTGYDRNGAGLFVFDSGNWRSTSAVSSITLISKNSANFVQYSHFALYGIKG